jgi:four helix bundle protein
MELETQLVIAERLQYLTPADAQALMERTAEVRRLLAGMVRALRAKQRRAVTDSQ